jgi:hypothetical protein
MKKALISGALCSLLGIALSCGAAILQVSHAQSVEHSRLFGPALILPWLGFLVGFVPYAKRAGQWPLARRAPRFVAAAIVAVSCAIAAYLTFVAASYIWNKPVAGEEQSVAYLIFHPAEVPLLRERYEYKDKPPVELQSNWPVPTGFVFVLGFFVGYVWSGRWDRL